MQTLTSSRSPQHLQVVSSMATEGESKNDEEMLLPPFMAKRKAGEEEETSKKVAKGGGKAGGGRGSSSSSGALAKEVGALTNLVRSVAQLSLINAAENREEKGYSLSTVLLPPEMLMVEEALKEGKVYQELIQEKKGQNCGAPHVRIAVASLKGLVEEGILAEAAMKDIKHWWKNKIVGKSSNDLMDEILVWKIRKPAVGKGFAKLTFKLKDQAVQQTIFLALEALEKTEAKRGPAPKGPCEREVQRMLAELG